MDAVTWTCPGCVEHRQRSHPSHTHMPNECKLFAPSRFQGRERKGAHPRAPRVPDVLAPPPPL
eukprot:6668038-Prorocentrum_lima.AAC.1